LKFQPKDFLHFAFCISLKGSLISGNEKRHFPDAVFLFESGAVIDGTAHEFGFDKTFFSAERSDLVPIVFFGIVFILYGVQNLDDVVGKFCDDRRFRFWRRAQIDVPAENDAVRKSVEIIGKSAEAVRSEKELAAARAGKSSAAGDDRQKLFPEPARSALELPELFKFGDPVVAAEAVF
jgi:hypothetical protein